MSSAQLEEHVNSILDILRKHPECKKHESLRALKDMMTCDDSSDDDEEAPPCIPQTSKEMLEEAQSLFDAAAFDSCLVSLRGMIAQHPNNVKAWRLRSTVHYKLGMYKEAYFDICEAQRIDYDDTLVSMQHEYKSVLDKHPLPPPPSPRTQSPASPIGVEHESKSFNETAPPNMGQLFQQLSQNPEIMQMAQTMMQNPEALNGMLRAMQK